jgi:predicted RNA-binding protein with PIN domain
MRYVIDGYNLLYATGLAHDRMGPHGLEKARLTLLGRLGGSGGAAFTVVFDASRPPAGVPAEQDHQGVRVLFALKREADELIEELIREDSAPRGLTVVSDDHRVQRAARRRHCAVLGCLDFIDRLSRPAAPAPPPEGTLAKPEGVSRAEAQHWLREFDDLARDRQIRADLNPGLPDDIDP